MGNPLLAKKPLKMLMEEAGESGEHTLKRTLGPVQLTALGIGAIIGAGIFVLSGLGAHYAGPGLMLSFVVSGLGCAFAGLCYAEFAAMIPLAGSAYTYSYAALGEIFAWIIGWDLTLEYAMGASTVSSGWSNHFIEFLEIFHIRIPLWMAYDHWTALRTAENIIARDMARAADPSLAIGSQAFLTKVGALLDAPPAELVQRATDLVASPSIRSSHRVQPSGFLHRLGDHRDPGGRYQGERVVQRRNRRGQALCGSLCDRDGHQVRQCLELGRRLEFLRAYGLFRHWGRRGLHLFRLYRL